MGFKFQPSTASITLHTVKVYEKQQYFTNHVIFKSGSYVAVFQDSQFKPNDEITIQMDYGFKVTRSYSFNLPSPENLKDSFTIKLAWSTILLVYETTEGSVEEGAEVSSVYKITVTGNSIPLGNNLEDKTSPLRCRCIGNTVTESTRILTSEFFGDLYINGTLRAENIVCDRIQTTRGAFYLASSEARIDCNITSITETSIVLESTEPYSFDFPEEIYISFEVVSDSNSMTRKVLVGYMQASQIQGSIIAATGYTDKDFNLTITYGKKTINDKQYLTITLTTNPTTSLSDFTASVGVEGLVYNFSYIR